MNDDESTSLMDATGLGLLPGMAIALALGVGVIGLALIDSWWVVPVVVLALGAITGAVVFVLLAVLEDDEDEEPGLRRHVPGLWAAAAGAGYERLWLALHLALLGGKILRDLVVGHDTDDTRGDGFEHTPVELDEVTTGA